MKEVMLRISAYANVPLDWEKTLIFFDEVDAYVHQKMMQLVNLYLLVGGMPAAVQTYLDTNDMQRVLIARTECKEQTLYPEEPERAFQIQQAREQFHLAERCGYGIANTLC